MDGFVAGGPPTRVPSTDEETGVFVLREGLPTGPHSPSHKPGSFLGAQEWMGQEKERDNVRDVHNSFRDDFI